MSLISNITVYLSTKYNLNGIFVVNVVNIWSGTSNVATLAGAFIADTCLGRYRTLLYGSIASFLVTFPHFFIENSLTFCCQYYTILYFSNMGSSSIVIPNSQFFFREWGLLLSQQLSTS